MSMLSVHCDELRAMAESVGLAMPKAATLMMDAADTIWELRESVHRERAEADRLRASNEVIAEDHAALCEQNAKLRELCETFGMIANDAICNYYERDEMLEQANATARELGVEL